MQMIYLDALSIGILHSCPLIKNTTSHVIGDTEGYKDRQMLSKCASCRTVLRHHVVPGAPLEWGSLKTAFSSSLMSPWL